MAGMPAGVKMRVDEAGRILPIRRRIDSRRATDVGRSGGNSGFVRSHEVVRASNIPVRPSIRYPCPPHAPHRITHERSHRRPPHRLAGEGGRRPPPVRPPAGRDGRGPARPRPRIAVAGEDGGVAPPADGRLVRPHPRNRPPAAGHDPLPGAGARRDRPDARAHRRDADRRGEDPHRHPAGRPARAGRPRGARRHHERLPRLPRRRIAAAGLRGAGAVGRLRHRRNGTGRAAGGVREGHHLRHGQGVRVRLPAGPPQTRGRRGRRSSGAACWPGRSPRSAGPAPAASRPCSGGTTSRWWTRRTAC